MLPLHLTRRRAESPDVEHVVHVGFPKTASTWLQRCVFPHLDGVRYGNLDPEVRQLVGNLVEVDGSSFAASGFRSLLRHLGDQPGGPLLISDEAIASSMWGRPGLGLRNAERLFRVAPGARIMVLVRRQDEMLRSIHAQYVNEGGHRLLEDFVHGNDIEGCEFGLSHLEFDRLVRRYAGLFGRDRVWVIPYEHLRADQDGFVAELCAWLGTAAPDHVSQRRLNRSLSRPSLRLLRAWNRLFRESSFNAEPRVAALPRGRVVRNVLQRRVDPLLRHLAWDTSHGRDTAMLAELATGFVESNRRLQAYCDYPLADWGYPLAPAIPVEVVTPVAARPPIVRMPLSRRQARAS